MDGEHLMELGQVLGKVDLVVGIFGVVALTTRKVVDMFTLKVSYPDNTMQPVVVVLLMVG
jgi:hypothetical protein